MTTPDNDAPDWGQPGAVGASYRTMTYAEFAGMGDRVTVFITQEELDKAAKVAAKLRRLDRGAHHAALSAITHARSERIAPPRLDPVAETIVTNGPNSQPTTLHTVGQKVAA